MSSHDRYKALLLLIILTSSAALATEKRKSRADRPRMLIFPSTEPTLRPHLVSTVAESINSFTAPSFHQEARKRIEAEPADDLNSRSVRRPSAHSTVPGRKKPD